MKYLSARVKFQHSEPELTADLIADVFHGFGIQGVVIEIPRQENDVDWADDALKEAADSAVTGYFPVTSQTDDWCRKLNEGVRAHQQRLSFQYNIQYSHVDEEDWSESWKAYFWPERIAERLVVKPTWREFEPGPEDIVLEIDPGMAFGTGTHPTSSLCLARIERHIRPGDRFLDVGTGSGILMIAAAKLGASEGIGIDNDPVAVEVAGKNLAVNHIDPDRFRVIQGDLTDAADGHFDVVAANILTPVILKLIQNIGDVLKSGGALIVSGITEENRTRVIEQLSAFGMNPVEIQEKEGWVAIVAKRHN